MSKSVVIEIAGKSFTGQVSDLDGFFAAGLLMPDYEQILKKEEGLTEAFRSFVVEQQTMKVLGEGAQNAIAEAWGDRVVLRLTNNREIRLSFAQRIREVFPDIPKSVVSYDRWKDSSGNFFEEGSIRLDLADIMAIVTKMMVEGLEDSPAAVVEQAKPVAKTDEVADLRARLAIAEGKGFSPARSEG